MLNWKFLENTLKIDDILSKNMISDSINVTVKLLRLKNNLLTSVKVCDMFRTPEGYMHTEKNRR